MTDRELLELAAKAIGDSATEYNERKGVWLERAKCWWNPRDDDGDALRLAVRLGLDVEMHGCNSTHPYACAFDCQKNIAEEVQLEDGDPYAATRRAIVRAAAEMAK